MSKLINQNRLEQFATKLWAKIKDRYDDAFVNAEIPATEKKIKFTKKKGGDTVDVSLEKYTRLQDRNEFEQDVSADNVAITNNKYMGTNPGYDSDNRSLGFRKLTTSAFADGYVDHIRIYVDNTNNSPTSTWKVWAITKGANGQQSDRVKKVVHQSESIEVKSITENATEKKFVIIPIKQAFADETYFIVKCSTHRLEVAQTIKPEYRDDVVNLNKNQPPDDENSTIDWTVNANSNTAIMHLYGRESIGSLSLKLKQTQADSSLYVKHSETTDGTEQGEKAGKVVKLGTDGKLHSSLMPSIALNEYFSVTQFTHQALADLGHFENGDVVVVTSGGVVTKRYLCIDKENNTTNYVDGFVELNSKDGVVTSVNDLKGAINLALAAEEEKVKLNITSGGSTATTEIDIISTAEIDTIITSLPN